MVVPKLMFVRTMNVQCINKMNETNKHVWVIYIEFQKITGKGKGGKQILWLRQISSCENNISCFIL